MNKSKFGVIAAALTLGFVAMGEDAEAQSVSRGVRVVPMQAAGGTCAASLVPGVLFDDHAAHPDPHCKVKIAQHNKQTWLAKLASAVGHDKTLAEAHVKQWEHALGVATVAAMEKEYLEAKAAAAKAVGAAKGAATAAVGAAEKRLHDAIDAHEKEIERHALEIEQKLRGIGANAEKEVADLKAKWQHATGDMKHELEMKWLNAQHTLHRVEEVLATNELTAAQRKLMAAGKRVSAELASLKAKAQAEYDRIRAKVESIHRRVTSAIAEVKAKMDAVRAKAKNIVHHVHDEVAHVEHALKNVFHGLFG